MTTLPTTGPVTRPPRPPADLRMTPGRWATLAIGVPIALVLIGWSAFSLVASIGGGGLPGRRPPPPPKRRRGGRARGGGNPGAPRPRPRPHRPPAPRAAVTR